jgi:DNA polymerase I
LLNPNDKSEGIWGAAQVRAKAGVEPEQIVDWLSLVGDSVDNIPGVPGVGPKTAAGLLGRFGSVAGLYGRLAEVKSARIRAALLGAEAAVRRNLELVRLPDVVGFDFSPAALAEQPADVARLAELFELWGFRSLRAELGDVALGDVECGSPPSALCSAPADAADGPVDGPGAARQENLF